MKIDLPEKTIMYEAFSHVLKARASKNDRFCLTAIQVNPHCIVSTDGCRLHVVYGDFSKFTSGHYEVVKQTRKQIILLLIEDFESQGLRFVTWEAYIPQYQKFFTMTVQNADYGDYPRKAYGALEREGISLPIDSLLSTIPDRHDGLKVFFDTWDKPVLFWWEHQKLKYLALIMPIKPFRPMIEVEQNRTA